MNDPTVVTLFYRIEHGASVDYSEATPLRREEPGFRVEIQDEVARFEFKGQHATEKAAREAVEDYVRAWEFTAGLQRGPGWFRMRFLRSEIEDGNPTPGVANVSMTIRAGAPRMSARATVVPLAYPQPPSGIELTADVESMYARYMGYRQRREPLASMAYFCLTVLEYPFGGIGNKTKLAARKYQVSKKIFRAIRQLSSTRGGSQARKANGKDSDLTDQERSFLEEAVRVLVERAAQKDPGGLPKITKSDLPQF